MKSLLFVLLSSIFLNPSRAAESFDAAKETAIVLKYCGGCHSDALHYGGLSLQGFDAARPDPTITAMLISKLTSGRTTKDVSSADSAAVLSMMRRGAMGAAGQGVPDDETQVMFARALAFQSKDAFHWNSMREGQSLSAVIVREIPSDTERGVTSIYRLSIGCRRDTLQGEIKLTWADPPAREGQMMSVGVDNATAFLHKVEGGRAQGNGDQGPGATLLRITLPSQRLTISNLFGSGMVEFPLSELNDAARRDLAPCFAPN